MSRLAAMLSSGCADPELERRLLRLEHRLARTQTIVVACLVALAGLVSLGMTLQDPAPPDSLRVKVVDANEVRTSRVTLNSEDGMLHGWLDARDREKIELVFASGPLDENHSLMTLVLGKGYGFLSGSLLGPLRLDDPDLGLGTPKLSGFSLEFRPKEARLELKASDRKRLVFDPKYQSALTEDK